MQIHKQLRDFEGIENLKNSQTEDVVNVCRLCYSDAYRDSVVKEGRCESGNLVDVNVNVITWNA